MIPLIIIISVLAVIALLLFLPVSLDLKYDKDFFFKAKVGGIRVYEIKPEKDIKKKEPDTESDKKAEKQAEGFFTRLKNKHGLLGAVKEIFSLAESILNRLKPKLKHIAFRKILLNITVSTDDAAKTAVEYGTVCSAVYPVLSIIGSAGNIKYKGINISADFDGISPSFSFSGVIRVKIIFLIVMAFSAFSEYNNFKMRNEL